MGFQIGCPVGTPEGCPVGYPIGFLDWLIGRLATGLSCWLSGRLPHRLTWWLSRWWLASWLSSWEYRCNCGRPLSPPTGAFVGTTVGENVGANVGAKVVKLLIDVCAILNVGAWLHDGAIVGELVGGAVSANVGALVEGLAVVGCWVGTWSKLVGGVGWPKRETLLLRRPSTSLSTELEQWTYVKIVSSSLSLATSWFLPLQELGDEHHCFHVLQQFFNSLFALEIPWLWNIAEFSSVQRYLPPSLDEDSFDERRFRLSWSGRPWLYVSLLLIFASL